MNSVINNAIEERHKLKILYNGGYRLIEPFCYGLGRSHQELLRAFQTSGYSDSGEPFGWKLLRVDRIGQVEKTNEVFEGHRPDYNPNDSAMTSYFERI